MNEEAPLMGRKKTIPMTANTQITMNTRFMNREEYAAIVRKILKTVDSSVHCKGIQRKVGVIKGSNRRRKKLW